MSSQYNVFIRHNVQTPYYRAERYNEVLLYIYKIIFLKLKGVSKKFILEIVIKAINNFTNLDRLIPILLVFDAYP